MGGGSAPLVRRAVTTARRLDPGAATGWMETALDEMEGKAQERLQSLRMEFDRLRQAGEPTELTAMLSAYLSLNSGQTAEALRWVAALNTFARNESFPDVIRMVALGRMGEERAVRDVMMRHRSTYERDWQYSLWIASALAALGHSEEALDWVERCAALGSVD